MFVENYLKDLRRARYRPGAVLAYVRRCAGLSGAAALGRPRALGGILLAGAVYMLWLLGVAGVLDRVLGPGLAPRFLAASIPWLLGGMAWMGLHLGMLREEESLPRSGIGLPNALTLGRLLAVPAFNVFIVTDHLTWALAALLLGGLTDVADGVIARRFGSSTRLGRVFDPIVDVVFNAGIAVGLTRGGFLPGWLLAIILMRYSLLLFGAAYIYVFRGPVRVRPTPWGKTTGVLNTAVLFLLVAIHHFLPPDAARRLMQALYVVLTLVFSLTIVQVVIIGLYNIRLLTGHERPAGRLSILVGEDDGESGR